MNACTGTVTGEDAALSLCSWPQPYLELKRSHHTGTQSSQPLR